MRLHPYSSKVARPQGCLTGRQEPGRAESRARVGWKSTSLGAAGALWTQAGEADGRAARNRAEPLGGGFLHTQVRRVSQSLVLSLAADCPQRRLRKE